MSKNRKKKKAHLNQKLGKQNKQNVHQTTWGLMKEELKKDFKRYIHPLKNMFESKDIKCLIEGWLLDAKKYVRTNKTGVIFALALTMIVVVGYFAIVFESDNDELKRLSEMDDQIVRADLTSTGHVEEIKSSEEDKIMEIEALRNNDEEIEAITAQFVESDLDLTASLEEDEEQLFTSVTDSLMLGVDMYAIVVDGKEIAYLEHKEEAENIIKDLKDKYRIEEAVEDRVDFREDVEIKKVKRDIFDVEEYVTEEDIFKYIIKGTKEHKVHKVKKGESFSHIEVMYSLPYGSLTEANPDIVPHRLQIGQEISLIIAKPIINVISISVVERVDAIPYGKDPNVKTDKYFVGEYHVKRSGVLGEADVVVEVYKENGKVIGEKVLESEVIKEPINKIVYEGTKPAPPKIGTGTFQRPTSRGYITSGFGARWGSFHNGIDIGLPMRSNVFAADGGVVIYSGWKGTYGKLVIIDHGANMHSYYAHNDQLLVSAGERVFKGQVIAYSGNTGRSTGPHLHFEVRKNNRPVNPRNYVSY